MSIAGKAAARGLGGPGVACLLAVFACACAPLKSVFQPDTSSAPPLERVHEVLGPKPMFASLVVPEDRISEGVSSGGAISLTVDESLAAVKFTSGRQAAFLGSRTEAPLLATPFLTWSWKLSPHAGELHPGRLLVAFKGGSPDGTDDDRSPEGLPAHDRLLAITWGRSALMRGSLFEAAGEDLKAVRYVVRGGRAQLNTWRRDSVDLLEIYRRAWPDDVTAGVQVVFLGAEVLPGPVPIGASDGGPAYALISGIELDR